MAGIFISYRRDDSAGHAGRLFDRLAARFGRDAVFMDHAALSPGEDFHGAIDASLARAGVVLAVIGPRWVDARDAGHTRRLDQPDDFVRLELATAIARGARVIPLLVGGARMPADRDLPEVLAPLARLQAWEIRDARFDDDLNALVAQLALPEPPAAPSATHALAGEWLAEVAYPWGSRVTERFGFEVDGDEVFGWGTFLSARHPLEQVEVLPDGLRFVMHSDAVMGDERRRIAHRCRVKIVGDALQIRMQSSGGFDDPPPLTVTARRAP